MSDNRSDYQRDYQKEYQARTKRVSLVLSASEHRSVKKAAQASGVPVAAYVKRLALQAHEGQSSAPEELTQQLADLERVIRTIANNVNQMARHSNRIAHVLDAQEVFLHIHALQSELKASIARASSGLGSRKPPHDEGAP
jgi:cysteine sulfinate desulfinase/cysteine desulfurase-like protein